jgi:hypothetical protein
MKRILSLLFVATSAMAADPDLYVDFENVAAGTLASASIMGAISRTNGNAVTFSFLGTANKMSVESGDPGSQGLLRPVKVSGVPYTNSAPTRHLLVKADNTVNSNQQFDWKFAASRKVSIGFSITLSNFTGLGSFYNPIGIDGGSVFAYLSLINNNPPTMQAETNSSPSTRINVFNNRAIWVTALFDSANNRCIFDFYNQTNMAFIGRSGGAIPLNSTVSDIFYGMPEGHAKDAGTVYRLGSLILYTNGNVWPVWPGSNLQMPTNFTTAGIQAAHNACSDGDYLLFPRTNGTSTGPITISKSNLVISSMNPVASAATNETIILVDNGSTAFTNFMFTGMLNTTSNLTITGDGSNDEVDAIHNRGYYNRYSHVWIKECDIGFFAEAPGLWDNGVISDCHYWARNIFGSSFYDTNNPIAWNSTNFFVYEDSSFYWTSAKNASGSQPGMSSQEGQAFVVRHCYFELNKASTSVQPFMDYHGDNPPGTNEFYRPGTGLQIYSNYIKDVIGTSISGSKFADIRGGASLIYSNRWVGSSFASGDGIVYREEFPFPTDLSPYIVTNSYVWQNYHGTLGTTAMPINDDANLTDGIDYFSSALVPLTPIPYPHPQRNETIVPPPGFPTFPIPAFLGPGRSGVRVGAP